MTILNADRWLHSVITGDAQLAAALGSRVYVDKAPTNTQYPVAIIQSVSAIPVANISAERIMDDELWQVTVWAEGPSYLPLEPIADRIRLVVHRASGVGVIAAVYEGSRRMSEDNGKPYKAVLMEYRLYTQ